MKKIITTILTIAIITQPLTARADSYAITGMWIGAGIGATTGVILASSAYSECYEDCEGFPELSAVAILGTMVLGGLLGAGIGASVPKEPRISFSPAIVPTKNGVTAGGNLAIKF